jgi:hypothetical protein
MLLLIMAAGAWGADVTAQRFAENPLITVNSSPSIGDNVNGPSIIRVPDWVERPLGKYYMYFAHHKGQYIRLAYADSLRGPWRIHEPGVLRVEDTAFFRPQPDPEPSPSGVYTHLASPEIFVDEANKRIVMWAHGMWTEGKQWPAGVQAAQAFVRANGYAQYTQAAESTDGLKFTALAPITKDSYLRVFAHGGEYYGFARLGGMLRSKDLRGVFEAGPNPFRDGPYSRRVRHVALVPSADKLDVFFSVIGDAPEKILHTTISLTGDWSEWKASGYEEVLTPSAAYECPDMAVAPSEVGEIYGPAKQLRDPAVFVGGGKIYLFYTVCGEQGVGAAEVTLR